MTHDNNAHKELRRIETFSDALYAGTTIAAYWFPVVAFLVIFASQAIWIALSVTDDQ